jgi:hypothetical protein
MKPYSINIDDSSNEGGYCTFYPVKEDKSLGFKQFGSKTKADNAYSIQKKLSKFGLAPKILGKVCRLPYEIWIDNILYSRDKSLWGFITEKAYTLHPKSEHDITTLRRLQNLVNNIHIKTGLKFWDCHFGNVGLIRYKGRDKLVCIDTGKESFHRDCNAWGFSSPGPKCCECGKFQCKCSYYE